MSGSKAYVWALFPALLAACQRDFDEERMSAPPPPPAALIAPVHASMTLDEKLARLEAELAAAIEGGLRDEAVARMFRAEAITDRLLEGEPPFAWLARGYLVESKLRQIQVMGDRIVVKLRRGEPRDRILAEALEMHRAVGELRTALREEGGGEAPIPYDSLLAGAAQDTLPPPPTDEPAI